MKLGIIIPYYCNSLECENRFKLLMKTIKRQLSSGMILYIYEDGQISRWLYEYQDYNVIIENSKINKGVSVARNKGIEYLKDKVDYILFIDSDDMIESNYLKLIYRECFKNKWDIIESLFFVNDKLKEYGDKIVRTSVSGSAIRTCIIGNIRFKEDLQIGEDTDFMKRIWDKYKIKKKLVKTSYFYNLGYNLNSLTMRYKRKEIEESRCNNG